MLLRNQYLRGRGSSLIEVKFPGSSNPPALAWHYTDAVGLESILRTKRLWAGATFALNDRRELTYGADLMRVVWADVAKDADKLPAQILDSVLKRFGVDHRYEIGSNAYVLSASNNGDLLNQWHHYAGRGGFAIGLDVYTNLVPSGHPWGAVQAANAPTSSWAEVEYDLDAQRQLIRNLLINLLDLCAGTEMDAEERSRVEIVSYNCILTMIGLFKDWAFRDEREMRLITGTGSPETELFRISGGQIRPYIELGSARAAEGPVEFDPHAALPIRKIVIGPTSDETSREVISRLLARSGHHGVDVVESRVSLR